jgi:hypothetical protein
VDVSSDAMAPTCHAADTQGGAQPGPARCGPDATGALSQYGQLAQPPVLPPYSYGQQGTESDGAGSSAATGEMANGDGDWNGYSGPSAQLHGGARGDHGRRGGEQEQGYEQEYEQQSYEQQPYEQQPYQQPGYEQQSYEQQAYEQQGYEQQTHEQPAYEQQPYEQHGYEAPVYEAQATDQQGHGFQGYAEQPYEQQPYGGKAATAAPSLPLHTPAPQQPTPPSPQLPVQRPLPGSPALPPSAPSSVQQPAVKPAAPAAEEDSADDLSLGKSRGDESPRRSGFFSSFSLRSVSAGPIPAGSPTASVHCAAFVAGSRRPHHRPSQPLASLPSRAA